MALHSLNCQGMNCPMPIVEITKTARTLQEGEQIEVSATDLAFKLDVEAWARRMGHTVERFTVEEDIQKVMILLGSAK